MYGGLAFQSGAGEQVRKEGVFTLYTEPCCQAAIDACMHGIFSPTSLSDTENDQLIYHGGARSLHALACQRRSVPITEACQRASLVFPSPPSFIAFKRYKWAGKDQSPTERFLRPCSARVYQRVLSQVFWVESNRRSSFIGG
jgi:hypothetical protein